MSRPGLTLKALGHNVSAPFGRWQNRLAARRSRLGTRPRIADTLPDPVLFGDADTGQQMIGGTWSALGRDLMIGDGTIWDLDLSDRRLEAIRQSCTWLDDLAAQGNRPARELAQVWIQDWIVKYGFGSGPGWDPEIAGLRAKRWTAHSDLLTKELDREHRDRFWRALQANRTYLSKTWRNASPGLGQMRALAGLVWSGIVLPHDGHSDAINDLGQLAVDFINPAGEVATRAPSDLGEALILLIWCARILENADQSASDAHLAAIVRGVPILRPLRLGDGTYARFHGGGSGDAAALDQALAELRIGVQDKPKLAMGFCRLSGGRLTLVLDATEPPADIRGAFPHASTLAFELSASRFPLVVNCGPGHVFGRAQDAQSRATSSQSTVEIDGASSSLIKSEGIAASAFGPRVETGPSMVSINQAQDTTGQWLLATHDGYVASHGILHERRLFIDARGTEIRGEEILSVTDARARTQFQKVSAKQKIPYSVRFHIHPDVKVEMDVVRELALLTLPNDEVWMFRASGGRLQTADSVYFDPDIERPRPTKQVVVRADMVEYLGQVIWSIDRISEAQPESA